MITLEARLFLLRNRPRVVAVTGSVGKTSAKDMIASVLADVRTLPFRSDAFSLVVSLSTLDHFPSRRGLVTALLEVRRVLHPGGELLVTLDNSANPLIALRNALPFEILRRLRLVPYYVWCTLAGGSLRRTLTALGFRVTALEAILHVPGTLLAYYDLQTYSASATNDAMAQSTVAPAGLR